MAIRFRKSMTIFPGIRINLSKSGISTSVGPRGATINLRGGKRRLTTGIPGTGISHTQTFAPSTPPARRFSAWWLVVVFFLVVAWAALP